MRTNPEWCYFGKGLTAANIPVELDLQRRVSYFSHYKDYTPFEIILTCGTI